MPNKNEGLVEGFKQLAEKYGVDVSVIDDVWRSQFRFLRKHMSSTEKRPVRLIGFGIFSMKPKWFYYFTENEYLPGKVDVKNSYYYKFKEQKKLDKIRSKEVILGDEPTVQDDSGVC